MTSLVHDLWMLDFDNGVRFLRGAKKNSETSSLQKKHLRFPLARGSQTELPSLYGWVLTSVQIDGPT